MEVATQFFWMIPELISIALRVSGSSQEGRPQAADCRHSLFAAKGPLKMRAVTGQNFEAG